MAEDIAALIQHFGYDHVFVGVVVPEQGLVAPGMVIACGDSHTTTYGAFGAFGFGTGTLGTSHPGHHWRRREKTDPASRTFLLPRDKGSPFSGGEVVVQVDWT